ncbi:hypothetical protein MNV49_007209 [Pseudohyphozyma bogoriensis]|nr:hypothetical protein MNV49_007209 [Pseudohyphozyma bogoriensis]
MSGPLKRALEAGPGAPLSPKSANNLVAHLLANPDELDKIRPKKAKVGEWVSPPAPFAASSSVAAPKADAPAPPKAKATKATKAKPTKKQAAASGDGKYASVHDVKLEGEDDESVPIYDDCTAIRRKITAFVGAGNTTAHLLREMGGINSNALARFKKESGANGGAANQVYYHAYVYFEKLRIFEGKPKNKARLEAEATLGPQGYEREQRRGGWYMAV